VITADVYKFQSSMHRDWQRAYSHPMYDMSVSVEAETPEDLLEKLAERLGVKIEIKPKAYCGAV